MKAYSWMVAAVLLVPWAAPVWAEEDDDRLRPITCEEERFGNREKQERRRPDQLGPTEREMCRAVNDRLLRIVQDFADLKARCAQEPTSDNTVLERACRQTERPQGGVEAVRVIVRRFDKIACAKAQGKPGFFCDFRFSFSTNAPYIDDRIARLTGPGPDAQARFIEIVDFDRERREDRQWTVVAP